MQPKKKTAFLIAMILTILLLSFIVGTNSGTVVYHNSNGYGNIYMKTYYVPFWQQEVEPDLPQESSNMVFLGWHTDEGKESATVQKVLLEKSIDLYGNWMEKNPETDFLLPELHITTEIDRENIDRESYRVCTCTITNANTDDCLSDVVGQIKGRGNSTWGQFEKKPYKIKFDEGQNLFDMGTGKDWVLLNNSMDYTLMRNEIALEIGRILGLTYTSKCQWVHVFFNDEYLGIYLLCESVETGINRIDIESPYGSEDILVSFLIEMGGDVEGFEFTPVQNSPLNWGSYFTCAIRYPEPESITQYQDEYIYAYMQLVNEAILTANWEEIIDLVDIKSFIDWYLVNEITMNADMGWSMYAYKPQNDKLYLGPIWDFDQSCDSTSVSDINRASIYESWQTDSAGFLNIWFQALMEMEEFRTLLAEEWQKYYPQIQDFLKTEREKSVIYAKDIAANYERWPVLGTITYRIRTEIGSFKTYEENVDFLFTWLDKRLNWIDMELSSY